MKTASDELYEEILRERAAWKLAKQQDIAALLRLAGDAVVGGCGCEEGSSAVASARAGCGCSEAHPAKRRTSRASRQRQAAIQPGAERLPTEKPCFRTPFHFQLPDFNSIDLATQLCFALEFGIWDWPAEDCCPPLIRATDNCNPPTVWESALWSYVDEHVLDKERDHIYDSDITPAVGISLYDRQLSGAAISLLLDNIDIVLWATCLIQSWSSDLSGYKISDALSHLLTRSNTTNKLQFSITYILA